MHSLSSSCSLMRGPRQSAASALGCWVASAALISLAGVTGCSDDDEPSTVSLADSGSLALLSSTPLDIPTTTTVSLGLVWVVESQFSNYPDFGGMGEPGPFRLVGYPLAAGSDIEYVELPNNFYPEGITSVPSPDGRLYYGSIDTGAIYTTPGNNFDADPFILPNVLGGRVVGLTVSNDQTMIWACVVAKGAIAASKLVGIDIATAEEVVKHELPAFSDTVPPFCNDVIQSPNGALWFTESHAGRLMRVAPENVMTPDSAEIWLEGEPLDGPDGPDANAFGANGLTLVGGRLYIANSNRGTLWSIDPSLEEPTTDDLKRVVLTEGSDDNVSLLGPDGIARLSDTQLLIVENGLGLEGGKRVTIATLDPLE